MAPTEATYIVISPVRNEEQFIERTIDSMVQQDIRPAEWIVVNDGSTDRTGELIAARSAAHPWIRVVERSNRGFRSAGTGVIEAFCDGYKAVSIRDWEFIVKLDADLTFQEYYFAKCFEKFRENPRLGVGGGTIFDEFGHEVIPRRSPIFHVRGATKIYRRECWEDIGGLLKAPGWDTLDEVKANMCGWETRTFTDLHLLHHRPTGAADGSWKNSFKNGRANYISGYHPLFMLLKCLRRLVQKPYVLDSAGLAWGFLSGYLRRLPQVDDPALIKYLRRQQLRRLTFSESIWR